ncbi:MAG: PAS domain-containing protein [Bacteroidetes bacterium]|nr:PAS domain-containing protein [Bacteroidota bacterium]
MDNLNKHKSSEIDFKHIFDISPNLIFILDTEHNIIRANQAIAKRVGVEEDTLVGLKCFWCMHQMDQPHEFCAHAQLLKDGKEHNAEMFIEHLKGWFSINVTPMLDEEGKITGSMHIARDITEQKRIADALQKSEERYRKGQEVGHVGSWEFDIENATFWGSEEGRRLYGFTEEADSFTAEEVMNCVVERDRVNQALMDLIEKNKPYNIVFDIIPRDATERRTIHSLAELVRDVNGNPIKVTGVLHDITERKQIEDALLQEQYLLTALMDNIPDHIYFKDPSSRFFRNNKAHVLSFGHNDPDLLLGKSDFDFFVNEVAQRQYDDEQEIIRTGQSINKEEFTVRNDNSVNWYYSTKMPLRNKEGTIIGTFGISRDITDRKRAEEELSLKNEQLIKANAEKDKFFSIIAHDLRSPFNAFLGFTKMMAEELHLMSLEEIQKIALTMRKSATNLYSLLENLLEWSLLERGLTTFTPVSFLLMPKVSENRLLVLESANKKEIEICCNVPEDLVVYADENMLGGILRNLCTNAVKFTPKGGKVIIEAKPIPDSWLEISIKDTGIGMSKSLADNLFKLDIDTRRKGTENEPSTGLGLIICQEFIDKHNGKLWVESEVGKGTTFYFTLPAKNNG